ncbi:response regulator [Desertibacillus haloalkaliphilus]|uniref:response regulator n=1 Tax=Desertibacillus haloalkaliphilus TaxID=1328930 RepID=UPI001C262A9B|nr:response regulator [Desertibacillus haloalkaliphilus]MBU8905996.1 response regulator [Desertibacillus haloalkaliphilus]
MKSQTQIIDVMIIEDDEVAASSYTKFAEKLDSFKVTYIANTAEQALDLLEHHQPKLILLDIFLPDMHGIELLWEIRKKHRGIDIILITASKDTETVGEAIRGGAFSYIIKPVMMNRFIDTLKKYQAMVHKLDEQQLFVQNDVDNLFPSTKKEPAAQPKEDKKQLPKGIDKFTLTRIKDQMATMTESVNADECARLIGVSHSTARRYLEYLASEQIVEITLQHGAVGRPERRYRVKR